MPRTRARSGGPAGPAATAPVAVLNVTKRYDKFTALDNVTLEIAPAHVTAIVGPNGAGKSTFLGILTGSLRPDSGAVLLHGTDVTAKGEAQRAKLGLCRAFQVAEVFDDLTVAESLELAVAVRAGSAYNILSLVRRPRREEHEQARALAARFDLAQSAGICARQLSQADRKRLEIAMVIASGADVIALDEPTAGMGANEAEIVADVVIGLRDEGVSVVVVEHDMAIVERIADSVTIINNGQIEFSGVPADARRRM
jgi:branched-chain amino acid transport system ATP-binding protein